MDLITPASSWAVADGHEDPHHAHGPVDRMPLIQRVVMFISVVGPLAGLIVGIVLLWHRPHGVTVGWPEIVALLLMYSMTGFGVTIGFHRLLTHKAFETYRPIKLALATMGSIAGQGMCIRWVATHRRHHQQADRDGDPHSPHLHGEGFGNLLKGMFHAHVAWCFDADKPDLGRSVPDLMADPILVWIDKLYFFWVFVGCLIPAAVLGWLTHSWTGFWSGFVWGGVARIGLLQHVTWSINSVCHVWGERRFKIADHSTNNLPIALISFGEGWHNNHHAFPTSARHGLRWWELDPSYIVITLMLWTGLIWNVRLPSDAAMAAKSRK